MAAVIKEVVATYGQLDILVNNPDNFVSGRIGELTLDDFERSMAVNVRAAFVAINTAAQILPDGGRIIIIGEPLPSYAGRSGSSMYTTSKSALVGLTKGVAGDLAERRITVNILQPGPVNRDMSPEGSEYTATSSVKMVAAC